MKGVLPALTDQAVKEATVIPKTFETQIQP
jgi:hypothetical protein